MTNNNSQIYSCSNCGAQSFKWSGRCLECGKWGTIKQEIVSSDENNKKEILDTPAKIIDLKEVKAINNNRIKTNINEIDRVFGGGIVPGSLILIAGEPGIGKSTILAQIADTISVNLKKQVIYASGEESALQVKGRLERLNCNIDNISFISETNIEKIISSIKKAKPSLVIIDSIQTVYSGAIASEPGNISQIRPCAVQFLEVAKNFNIPIIIVGHITKDGQIAGPKTLEHIVDAVIYLENEKGNEYRILRAVKNRFGSINELGIFEMSDKGFKEIKNPSRIFLERKNNNMSGSVVSCVMEGTRPFAVEAQALVSKTVFGYPQRKASGYDLNRLQVLTAVLTKRAKISLGNYDIILNIVGGIKINDPALDLSVCLAIASSRLNIPFLQDSIVFGEVGLGGEIRNISRLESRLNEAEKLGYQTAIIPEIKIKAKKIKLKQIKNISDAIKLLIK